LFVFVETPFRDFDFTRRFGFCLRRRRRREADVSARVAPITTYFT
jgi:hypothetical protein